MTKHAVEKCIYFIQRSDAEQLCLPRIAITVLESVKIGQAPEQQSVISLNQLSDHEIHFKSIGNWHNISER